MWIVLVRTLPFFSTVKGRCKTRGLSGMLVYKPSGPPVVCAGSKSELANLMKVLRLLVMCAHDEAFGGARPPDEVAAEGTREREEAEEEEEAAEVCVQHHLVPQPPTRRAGGPALASSCHCGTTRLPC
jgi:hypothetical protein